MEKANKEQELESPSIGVFELHGEPAIVINGVPNVTSSKSILHHCNTFRDKESKRNTGLGEWLEGREVRKIFGKRFYSGLVTRFDWETGWYRVVYEDGDYEDLEWHELEEIILPLDITIPLKTLASKILRKIPTSSYSSSQVEARQRRRRRRGC